MSGELFGTKTRQSKILDISRKIRPYRHVYIRLIKPAAGSLSYEYVSSINDFGNIVIGIGDGAGDYSITLNSGLFHNLDNVIQEADIVHTTSSSPLFLTSLFTNETKSVIDLHVFDGATSLSVNIDGEIIVIIKEFYD